MNRAEAEALRDRARVRLRGFREFVRLAWPEVDPSPMVAGWHVDAICEYLEALARRELTDLVILQPPATSKSTIASVLFPAWVWTREASHGFLCASYDGDLVLRDARKSRTLIISEWYRARWPEVRLPDDASASKAVGFFGNTAGGHRLSITVRGGATGKHADTHVYDDLLDPQGADLASGVELDTVRAWLHETMPTRFRDQRTRGRVLVMQRLHERDPAADMIAEGAKVLCLPMEHDRSHPYRYQRDPRTADGELLEPTRFPREVVEALKTTLGPRATAAQLQQRPSPAGGSIFLREWLRNYWTVLPPGGVWSQSWDLAFKAQSDSDYVCGQVWYQHGANHYLVDQVLARLGFNATCDAIRALSARYPRAVKKRIEDKANGPAVIDALRAAVPGIEAINPQGGKEARAQAVEPLFAAGNVFLPHPDRAEYEDGRRGAPWVRGGVPLDAPEAARGSYEWFMVTFPNADHDDPVDATTQHLVSTLGGYVARLRAAVDAQMTRAGGRQTALPQRY